MLVGSASVEENGDDSLSYISVSEVEVLASGFASDGMGGISTMELCQTLFTLLYHVIQQRE